MNKYNDVKLQLLIDAYILAFEFSKNPRKRNIRKKLWDLDTELTNSGVYNRLTKGFGSFTFGYMPTGWVAQLHAIEHKRLTVERKNELFYYMIRNLRKMIVDYLTYEYNLILYSWRI